MGIPVVLCRVVRSTRTGFPCKKCFSRWNLHTKTVGKMPSKHMLKPSRSGSVEAQVFVPGERRRIAERLRQGTREIRRAIHKSLCEICKLGQSIDSWSRGFWRPVNISNLRKPQSRESKKPASRRQNHVGRLEQRKVTPGNSRCRLQN